MRGKNIFRTNRSRLLRQADNDCEVFMWSIVRDRRLNGFKFVRQFAIGPYFADFACRKETLVVELDGSQHVGSVYDRKRDYFMTQQGWSVLRFWNSDVFTDQAAVEDTILAVLENRLDDSVHCSEFIFARSLADK